MNVKEVESTNDWSKKGLGVMQGEKERTDKMLLQKKEMKGTEITIGVISMLFEKITAIIESNP